MNNEKVAGNNRDKTMLKPLHHTVGFAIVGLIGLSAAFGQFLKIGDLYGSDVSHIMLVSNWFPWVGALLIALGWFTAQSIETALLNQSKTLITILFLLLLFEIVFADIAFRKIIDHVVFNHFSTPLIVLSGAFLRYSTFRQEALEIQKKMVYGDKL
jgi:hypothetical protein